MAAITEEGTLAELAATDAVRRVAVVREMTKLHEEVWRGTAAEAAAAFAVREVRGEVVLVIGGAPPPAPMSDDAIDAAVRHQLRLGSEEGPRQIAGALAAQLGVPRRQVYEAVLRLRGEEDGRRRE